MSEPQHVHLPTSRRGDTNAYCSICGYFPLPLDAARLSHDRGADAVYEAISRLAVGDPEYPLHKVLDIAARALSVPAPTLPALVSAAEALLAAWPNIVNHPRLDNVEVAALREALRDAV